MREEAAPELIGERLTRSHTLHTKLLTVPGMASMAAVVLLGVITVALLGRSRNPQPVIPTVSTNELGLPAQVEVALNQGQLDLAANATKELIEAGEYAAAIAALETADNRQQQDVIVSFFKGRAQWSLAKQGSTDYSADDAMRSWTAALDSEPDWMEIAMALGFAQYAVGREELALEAWNKAIELAERQGESQSIYFSDKPASEYILNAYAGLAMTSLSLAKIEANNRERNRLLDQADNAYRKVISESPADFSAKTLGGNWLWLSPAIADWTKAKQELSQNVE